MNNEQQYSRLAVHVANMRDPALGVERNVFGYLLHTTGRGITDKARKLNRSPLDVALDYYRSSQNGANGYTWGGPSYVIDHDGEIYQLAPDNVKTAHAGDHSEKYPTGTRAFYLDGTWEHLCAAEVVAQWREKWPAKKHPYSLFPSTSPNADYVGVEMIPIGDGFGGKPRAPGLLFTQRQHDAAIALGKDLAERHSFALGWAKTGRLVGHEDVDPLNRCDGHGGWDPGWLRRYPYFDFGYVRAGLS